MSSIHIFIIDKDIILKEVAINYIVQNNDD